MKGLVREINGSIVLQAVPPPLPPSLLFEIQRPQKTLSVLSLLKV